MNCLPLPSLASTVSLSRRGSTFFSFSVASCRSIISRGLAYSPAVLSDKASTWPLRSVMAARWAWT